MSEASKNSLSKTIKQSPPVDLLKPYNLAWIKGKHVVVTGGASGFGEGFVREWARAGASLLVSDINVQKGDEVVRKIRRETGNENVHFVACDVRDWQQQVDMFKEAVKLSPHGGIDVVVANAGIAGPEPLLEAHNFETAEPQKPDFKVLDVNLYGVLYTTQLAIYWLEKNPGSKASSPDSDPSASARDRCILLIGSIASISPIPSQPLYGASKHGVLGLFRTLRASTFVQGIRVNMLCPYFIETAIISAAARAILAGAGVGKVEDVVDAASRLVADSSILGRALCVGPKVTMKQEDGEWVVVPKDTNDAQERAIWEVYADDFEHTEAFTRRMVQVLKSVEMLKGWTGLFTDILSAIRYAIFG